MASLMENLIDVLNKECSEYEVLFQLSQKKTPIIVSGNLEELQKITDEEQTVVNRVTTLEHKRLEITADIASVLNKDVRTLKLADLIDLLKNRPAEQKELAIVHDRLQASINGLKGSNEQNRELIESCLEMVGFEMNLLQAVNAAPETANYTKGAYTSGNTMGVAQSGFDAKQ